MPWVLPCVESALAQTWSDVEILVHDDGSTDGTRECVEAIGNGIIVTAGRPEGSNRARNRLLAKARGEWVQFLDADDMLEPEKISRQLTEAGNACSSADVLYSPVWIETWNDNRMTQRSRSELETTADLPTQWLTWQLPQTGGALWRKASLERLGGWKQDQPCCQEHELYLRAIQSGLRFHYCPTPGAVYRIWSEHTLCRKDPIRVIREKTKLIDTMLDWLATTERLQNSHRHAAAQACFEMARTWAGDDIPKAAAYFAERQQRKCILPQGPAAPLAYRLVLGCFGFDTAERTARLARFLK